MSCFLGCTRFAYEISCFLAVLGLGLVLWFHEISKWAFLLFDPKVISLWDFMLFSRKVSYETFLWAEITSFYAVPRFSSEFPCFLAAYLSYEISCFWSVTRFPYEISCFLSLKRFHEIFLWDFMILRSLWDFFVSENLVILCLLQCSFRLYFSTDSTKHILKYTFYIL